MQTLVNRYQQILTTHPFAVNSATGFGIAVAGDVICQGIEGKPYSFRRTMELGIMRAAILAPILTVYFPFLSRLVPGTTPSKVVQRVIADQIIGGAVIHPIVFFSMCCLQGKPETFPERMQEHYLPTLATSFCYWPFVHYFNFSRVPLQHQSGVAHVASILWSVVLSYRASAPLPTMEAGKSSSVGMREVSQTLALDSSASGGGSGSGVGRLRREEGEKEQGRDRIQ